MPSIVCTTSWVEISRERPRRMPASIIASASSAKYAGPEPGYGSDRVHVPLGQADDCAEMGEALFCQREVLVAGVRPRTDPGDPLVDGGRRVGHCPDDRNAVRELRLDGGGGNGCRDGEHGLFRRQCRPDLGQQRLDVLWFHGDDDEPGARDGLGVRERRLDAVTLVQLIGALLATSGHDDLTLLPPA